MFVPEQGSTSPKRGAPLLGINESGQSFHCPRDGCLEPIKSLRDHRHQSLLIRAEGPRKGEHRRSKSIAPLSFALSLSFKSKLARPQEGSTSGIVLLLFALFTPVHLPFEPLILHFCVPSLAGAVGRPAALLDAPCPEYQGYGVFLPGGQPDQI